MREAGRIFAVPVYAFIVMLTVLIVTGVVREIFWGLPQYDPAHIVGAVPVHQGNGLIMGATVLVLLRAFANGGTSLTGVEAIADAVNVFRQPQGPNARRVLTRMACILGFLLVGVIYLVHATHATPYIAEYPSMLSEVGRAVFGSGAIGNVMYIAAADGERSDLVLRRQYQFQRFSCTDQFRCRGQLSAAADDEARPSAGVLQRHHRADRVRGRRW